MELNVVEVAVEAGNVQTLLAAADAAGLAGVLATEELTVFAPTDEAFARIPEEDLEALTQVLLYHAASGYIRASEVVGRSTIETLQGSSATVSVNGGVVTIDDATVLAVDIETSNGMIHVIDGVLMP